MAKTVKLEHDDAKDYVHVHYEVSAQIEDGFLKVTEIQYAGSDAPRERAVRIAVAKPSEIQCGAWHASK
jgi:hypothetical protein